MFPITAALCRRRAVSHLCESPRLRIDPPAARPGSGCQKGRLASVPGEQEGGGPGESTSLSGPPVDRSVEG